jgi:formamidase
MIKIFTFYLSVIFVCFNLQADTTDSKWKNIIEVTKKGDHCKDDKNCFNRYHPKIKPVAKANQGDIIVLHTRDALDSNYNLDSVADDVPTFNLGEVHPMTGPVL